MKMYGQEVKREKFPYSSGARRKAWKRVKSFFLLGFDAVCRFRDVLEGLSWNLQIP